MQGWARSQHIYRGQDQDALTCLTFSLRLECYTSACSAGIQSSWPLGEAEWSHWWLTGLLGVQVDFMPVYAAHLREIIKKGIDHPDNYGRPLEGFKIIVDAGNGSGGFLASDVLAPLGADTTGVLLTGCPASPRQHGSTHSGSDVTCKSLYFGPLPWQHGSDH